MPRLGVHVCDYECLCLISGMPSSLLHMLCTNKADAVLGDATNLRARVFPHLRLVACEALQDLVDVVVLDHVGG